MSNRVIAIDGPSASGKSTVARLVAARLGWLYVDSGSVYRGITWQALRAACEPSRPAEIAACLQRMKFEFFVTGGAVRFRINGGDPGQELRSETVSERVSEVSAIPEVRAAATAWLRDMRGLGSLVMEGRDIGTVVFPNAAFKFYLDASAQERARRRSSELEAGRGTGDVARVRAAIERRDQKDRGRPNAPLRVADGATVIDTTGLSVDAVVARIAQMIGRMES